MTDWCIYCWLWYTLLHFLLFAVIYSLPGNYCNIWSTFCLYLTGPKCASNDIYLGWNLCVMLYKHDKQVRLCLGPMSLTDMTVVLKISAIVFFLWIREDLQVLFTIFHLQLVSPFMNIIYLPTFAAHTGQASVNGGIISHHWKKKRSEVSGEEPPAAIHEP